MKPLVLAAVLTLAFAGNAKALMSGKDLQQWDSTDAQMHDLVRDGYQLMAIVDNSKPGEGNLQFYLQKGPSLARCLQISHGEIRAVMLSCTLLTAPYVERPTR